MTFGVLYELQLPRPWGPDAEYKLVQNALDQVELADKAGADYAWAVEHHFLEEYAHCSGPKSFRPRAANAPSGFGSDMGLSPCHPQSTRPFGSQSGLACLTWYRRTGRIWYRRDLVQRRIGRVPGNREDKHAMWREALEVVVRMMVEEPFGGHNGRFVKAPVRNVIPKPRQKPHPPLWLACSKLE